MIDSSWIPRPFAFVYFNPLLYLRPFNYKRLIFFMNLISFMSLSPFKRLIFFKILSPFLTQCLYFCILLIFGFKSSFKPLLTSFIHLLFFYLLFILLFFLSKSLLY